jgi:endonuclease-3 related protein
MNRTQRRDRLLAMYRAMLAGLGPSRWWPGDTPFEVAVGAVLTQNTNWTNVERAIANLKAAGPFTCEALLAMPVPELEERLRPAGYFRLKTRRLRNFLEFLRDAAGHRIEALAERDLPSLREALLAVKGVGPETADSILLYALGRPVFVIDAYTFRILSRHGLVPEEAGYHELQDLFMDVLPSDAALFNEYHALLVRVAKAWCAKAAPRCAGCPLNPFLP